MKRFFENTLRMAQQVAALRRELAEAEDHSAGVRAEIERLERLLEKRLR